MAHAKSHLVDLKAFGSRVKQARALAEVARVRAGLPRATGVKLANELSEFLGESVSDRDVGRWLRGESAPKTLLRLWGFARILNVDPGWLAFGTELSGAGPTGLSAPPAATPEPMPRTRQSKRPTRRRGAGGG